MKKYFFILVLILTGFTLKAQQSSYPECLISITSNEVNLDSSNSYFYISYKIYFLDSITTDSLQITAELPKFSEVDPENLYFTNTLKSLSSATYNPGDSLSDSIKINYSTSNLPYHLQTIHLEIQNDTGMALSSCEAIRIYLTPYNTFEIWNLDDFEKLVRMWDAPTITDDTLRTFIHKDSIPNSDLADSIYFFDSMPISYLSMPGLAYSIPMQKIVDTFDYPSNNNGTVYRADDCGASKKRWLGNVTGRLIKEVDSDLIGTVDIPISGIKVTLMDKDGGLNPDDELGVTWTDENGNFSIAVNECQRFTNCLFGDCEGDALELYLLIESSTAGKTINVRTRIGGTRKGTIRRSNPLSWGYNNGENDDINMGNEIRVANSLKPQLLHWANLARNFVNGPNGLQSEGIILAPNKQKQLDIMIFPFVQNAGAMMIPGGVKLQVSALTAAELINFGVPPAIATGIVIGAGKYISNDDCIYMGEGSEDNEDMFFHEFGHYVMWHAQGKSWQNPIEASFAVHYEDFNTKSPGLAWNEGWATGIGTIIDNFYRAVDNEAGIFDDDINVEDRAFRNRLYENVQRVVHRDNTQAMENTVTHGFVSEGNIGSVIYDLYDGPGKPGRFAGGTESFNTGELDNVSLTFAQICKPLINNQGQGFLSTLVIQDITHYAFELTESLPCDQKAQIKPLFDANMISSFDNPISQQVSTDRIELITPITHDLFKDANGDNIFDFDGTATFNYPIDVPIIGTAQSNFNLKFITGESNAHVSDSLTVTGGRTFHFNTNTAGDWANAGTANPPVTSRLSGLVSSNFTLNNGSTMEIGSGDESTFADVSFCNGSQLALRNDANSNPNTKIVINNGSKLVIEKGAVFEYYPNTRIILNGSNAVLEIRGELRLMNGATFAVEGNSTNTAIGHVLFHKDWSQNSPRLINGNGSVNLNGLGNSVKLVEITGDEGLVVFNDITSFSITNAKVEMGEDAKLIVEASQLFSMDNVNLTAKDITKKHDGIHVWGCGGNSFSNMDVSYGTVGFNNYPDRHNRNGGSSCRTKLKLDNVNIANCDIGILSEGNELVFKGGTITGFTNIGWKATAQSTMSLLNDINIESNVANAQGIKRYGNGTVHIYNSKIHETKHGLYTEGGFIRPNCTEIYNTDGIGSWHEGRSTLAMSNASRTRFTDNADQHILSRYNGVLQFKDGENGFINSTGNVGYWASLSPNQPFTLSNTTTTKFVDASLNHFSSTMTPQTTQFPFGTENYLHHDNSGYAGSPIFSPYYYHILTGHNTGTSYLSTTAYTTHWNANCPKTTSVTQGDWKNWTDEIDFNDKYGKSGGGSSVFYSIPTQTNIWGTSTLGDNYAAIASLSSDTTANPKEFIEKSIEILNIDFSNDTTAVSAVNASLQNLYEFTTRAYMFAFSKYTQYHDSIDSTNLNSINSDLLTISSTLIGKADSNVAPWKDMYYTLCLNKSNVYRLSRDHDDAITELTYALTKVSDSTDTKYLNRWKCVNENERDNRLDSIFTDSTQQVFDVCYSTICQGTYDASPFDAPPMPNTSFSGEPNEENSYLIYPNPTSNGLWIETKSKLTEILVYNIQGLKVNAPVLKVGEKWFISTSSLSNGIYSMALLDQEGYLQKHRITILR